MILQEAKDIAIELVNELSPFCDIINIAGSIRREKPEPKDIEIVCVPKMIEKPKDLFGGDQGMMRVPEFAKEIDRLGDLVKGKPTGKYLQIDMVEPAVKIDVFMPSMEDFWRIMVIRTGSADWVSRFIAGGWKKLGWCGSDAGLRLKEQCHGTVGPDNKTTWKCVVAKDKQILPPAWKSERELFDWLKIKWIEPKYRNV